MKTKDPIKVERGKKSRQSGSAFELRVRKDLEEKGWIVDKWSNNVEFIPCGSMSDAIFKCEKCNKEIKFLFDNNGADIFCNDFTIDRNTDIGTMIRFNLMKHEKFCKSKIKQIADGIECDKFGKIIPAKAKWRGPGVPMMMSAGFPDFIAIRLMVFEEDNTFPEHLQETCYEVIGVEVKTNGILKKEEKQKCQWYLDNNVFSKILIAKKTKVKNRIVIVYEDFMEKYGSI